MLPANPKPSGPFPTQSVESRLSLGWQWAHSILPEVVCKETAGRGSQMPYGPTPAIHSHLISAFIDPILTIPLCRYGTMSHTIGEDVGMHISRSGHLITWGLLVCCARQPSMAANPAPQSAPAFHAASGQGEDGAKDIALVYERICLAAFPDETKLQAGLAGFKAVELDQAEVQSMLHGDPGRGWRLSGTPFTVTVEAPPYRTCAVRRMTRDGFPTANPYVAAVNAYSQQHRLQSGPIQQVDRRLPSGADTTLLATPLLRAGTAQPVEISMYVTTNYHGRFDPTRSLDAVGGVGVEVRLAHQLVPVP
jgi:hypothetical protein